MHELKLLLLLIIANGTPILAYKLLGDQWNMPVDARLRFFDGRALLGSSKTIRGILSSLLVTALVAPLFELTVIQGALLAFFSMCGDLCSSFFKRRLGISPSEMALGIDQIPEALFPLLIMQHQLQLTYESIAVIVVIFFIAELVISRILYYLRIRNRPY